MYELSTLGYHGLRRTGDTGPQIEGFLVVRRPKHFALLTYLAMQDGELCRRDRLIALFWPESDEAHARNALSKTLSRIRADLGDRVIRTVGAHEVGLCAGSIRVDVHRFRTALCEGNWAGAVEAYAGDFLLGFHLPKSPSFGAWLEDQRNQLRAQAASAAVRLAELQEKGGDFRAAVLSLRRAISIVPTDEATTRRLMALLHRSGQRTAALKAYHTFADLLHAELQTTPEDATRELATQIRASTAIRSLAVLPWANLTGTADQEHLTDGLTDLIITELARTVAGRVISRQSSLSLKGSDLPLSQAGRLLGVDGVIEGSLVRHGHRVTVTAQLIRVEPEEHLWAKRLESSLTDLPEIAREIARAVAERVRDESAVSPPARTGKAQFPVDSEAYEAYLRGRHFSAMLPQLGKAITYYRASLERAPEYGPAWAGLASAYAILTLLAHFSPEVVFPPFRQAVERAVQLDAQLGEAHSSRGLYRMLAERNWHRAGESLARGAELAAGAAEPHTHYVVFLAAMGRFEQARAHASRALELDPLGAGAWFSSAWCTYKAGHHAESNRQLHELLELHPHFGLGFTYMALNYALLGEPDQAAHAARRGMQMLPQNHEALALGTAALGRVGRTDEAHASLTALLALGEMQYLDPWAVAVAYTGIGQIDNAVQWFRRMYDERSPSAFCIRHDPILDPIRDDARFRDILRRLAFPVH